jgi:hypothetical protein
LLESSVDRHVPDRALIVDRQVTELDRAQLHLATLPPVAARAQPRADRDPLRHGLHAEDLPGRCAHAHVLWGAQDRGTRAVQRPATGRRGRRAAIGWINCAPVLESRGGHPRRADPRVVLHDDGAAARHVPDADGTGTARWTTGHASVGSLLSGARASAPGLPGAAGAAARASRVTARAAMGSGAATRSARRTARDAASARRSADAASGVATEHPHVARDRTTGRTAALASRTCRTTTRTGGSPAASGTRGGSSVAASSRTRGDPAITALPGGAAPMTRRSGAYRGSAPAIVHNGHGATAATETDSPTNQDES